MQAQHHESAWQSLPPDSELFQAVADWAGEEGASARGLFDKARLVCRSWAAGWAPGVTVRRLSTESSRPKLPADWPARLPGLRSVSLSGMLVDANFEVGALPPPSLQLCCCPCHRVAATSW